MGKLKNQAVSCHPLFFDPLNMKTTFTVGEDGKRQMSYVKEREGVTVYDNGEVEFCYYAPGAKSVQVAGISGSMSRDKLELEDEGNGYFSKRVKSIAPGFHYHNWFVDGNAVRNPLGAFTYGCFEPFNFFEIPEGEDDFYLLKDVPHGEIRQEIYTSSVSGHVKACYVYTPPKYSMETEKAYPVLYIQHGVGENEIGWIWSGKLNFILDNLLAQGKCREMIVVMCSGYAFKQGEDPVFYPGDFDKELTEDCIPFIEKSYRVKSGKNNRAMAGLSLGSAQATLTVSKHMDMFSSLGVFSGAAVKEMDKILSEEDTLKLVFLSGGKGEGNLLNVLEEYKSKFLEKGTKCLVGGYQGFHEWHVWRKALCEYAQNLFTWDNNEGYEANNSKTENNTTQLKQQIVSAEQLIKQTIEEQPLFFDPVYKNVVFAVDEKGRPAGRYKDMKPGVVIKKQGEVEFNFLAPNAESVEVQLLGNEKFTLKKADGKDGEEGYWTGVLDNIGPGFHYHEYYLNGMSVINPWAPLSYGCFKPINFFEMPEPDFELHQLKNVLHGSIRMNYYKSSQTDRVKLCYVYTPPRYDKNLDKSYPVLYLQHGGGENETAWVWQGKISNILDNMISENKCEEMLVVMNTGYSFRMDGNSNPLLGSVTEEIVEDCIPFIDSFYRTKKDRVYRAMAGTSMGGMQTQRTVFKYPNIFAWAGILSGGLTIKNNETDYSTVLLDKDKFKDTFRMLFVACGKQDGLYKFTMDSVNEVLQHEVSPELYFTDGYHDWTFWRHSIAEFLKKLFR